MLKTVSWQDVNFAKQPGAIRVDDQTLAIKDKHIARWQDDPEGRFAIIDPAEEGASAQLEKFYPSL